MKHLVCVRYSAELKNIGLALRAYRPVGKTYRQTACSMVSVRDVHSVLEAIQGNRKCSKMDGVGGEVLTEEIRIRLSSPGRQGAEGSSCGRLLPRK